MLLNATLQWADAINCRHIPQVKIKLQGRYGSRAADVVQCHLQRRPPLPTVCQPTSMERKHLARQLSFSFSLCRSNLFEAELEAD